MEQIKITTFLIFGKNITKSKSHTLWNVLIEKHCDMRKWNYWVWFSCIFEAPKSKSIHINLLTIWVEYLKGYSCLYKPTKNHINWKLGISTGFKTIFTIFVLEQGSLSKEQELRKNWESVFVSVASVRWVALFSKENPAFRLKVFVLLQIPLSLPRSITATPHLSRSVLCSFVRKKSVQF